jgi:hypothetical protein
MRLYKERPICRKEIGKLLKEYHCTLDDLLFGNYCTLSDGLKKQARKMLQEKITGLDTTTIRISQETKTKLIRVKGWMVYQDGKNGIITKQYLIYVIFLKEKKNYGKAGDVFYNPSTHEIQFDLIE